jgi:hypothetical protein
MKSVDPIVGRLDAVAYFPRPWRVVEEADQFAVVCRINDHHTVRLAVTSDLGTAIFIAHAPFDIAHLLARITDLEELVDELRDNQP